MAAPCAVPPPVLFNCLKHHLGYIHEYIKNTVASGSTATLAAHLLLIGESQMDLYLGVLPPEQISLQIMEHLQKESAFAKDAYINLIQTHQSSYHTMAIVDTSMWVLRLGEQPERYVHIHPGRYSPHTIRVKAGALKTAIALSVWMKLYNHGELTVELLNYVRKDVLTASPVKSLTAVEGFVKLFKLVNKEY